MNREEVLEQIWSSQDDAYELMSEYDSLPHRYGDNILYQAEAYVVNLIGQTSDITTTELAGVLSKTPSACSQIVKKLINKQLVEQFRNSQNKRVYNLRLTERGEQLYQDHIAFNEKCKKITFSMLKQFSEEDLKVYIKVQQQLNEAYRGDVRRSKERYGA